MQHNATDLRVFQETVWNYFHGHGRQMPWREPEPAGNFDAYKILVSEFMLQQTQVSRVVPKFQELIATFPTLASLATANLGAVLTTWSGLGYNRRAKFLHQTAQSLISKDGTWKSWNYEDLVACPGIGANTAGAILVYTYNQPVVFIETNIRTALIYHFFLGQENIPDTEIKQLVETTLDREQPRQWYWALMDYGSHLKTTVGNASRASKTYARQSTFQGSTRQIRGQIIRLLTVHTRTPQELATLIPDPRLQPVLVSLIQEDLITQTHHYKLA